MPPRGMYRRQFHLRVSCPTNEMEGDASPAPAEEPSSAPAASSGTTLYDTWTLWAHLPHDTDWSLKSYRQIMTFGTVEEAAALMSALPDALVRNCMLFIMRKGVHPTWEDEKNRDGGSFSYKVSNKSVVSVWRQLSYALVGESLARTPGARADINGATISPKKNFCIIKVWMASCKHMNPAGLVDIDGIPRAGCIFKKHVASS